VASFGLHWISSTDCEWAVNGRWSTCHVLLCCGFHKWILPWQSPVSSWPEEDQSKANPSSWCIQKIHWAKSLLVTIFQKLLTATLCICSNLTNKMVEKRNYSWWMTHWSEVYMIPWVVLASVMQYNLQTSQAFA